MFKKKKKKSIDVPYEKEAAGPSGPSYINLEQSNNICGSKI